MGRVIKLLVLLAIIGFLGLVGYAYLGVTPPAPQPVTKPAVLDGN